MEESNDGLTHLLWTCCICMRMEEEEQPLAIQLGQKTRVKTLSLCNFIFWNVKDRATFFLYDKAKIKCLCFRSTTQVRFFILLTRAQENLLIIFIRYPSMEYTRI